MATQLPKYRSRRGYDFTLSYAEDQLPESANYWRFTILVCDPSGRQRSHVVGITKKIAPTVAQAEAFLRGDPIARLHALLETYDGSSAEIWWPDFGGSWFLV